MSVERAHGLSSLTSLSRQQVRVAVAPLATVAELTYDALTRRLGSPDAWLAPVRQSLEPCDLALLGPVYAPRTPFIPDMLTPPPPSPRSSLDEELDRVASIPPSDLVGEIAAHGQLDGPWSFAARHPKQWIDRYVAATRRAWTAVEPLWHRAGPLFEREVERVATALTSGALEQVLDGLFARGHAVDDAWFLHGRVGPVVLAPGLILQPMVIGVDAGLITEARGAVTHFGYPLPRARRLAYATSAGLPDEDALAALVGSPRAAILRRLDQVHTAGALAREVSLAPSAVTHHLAMLERAGLVRREKVGRRVVVHRSKRGTALLNLYD